MMEQTLVMIKPNVVKKARAGQVMARWEQEGFRILGMKQLWLTRSQAAAFYAEHRGKPFFDGLVDFMTSGPIVALVLERENAIAANRDLMGPTDPAQAGRDTLRGQFADSLTKNAVHGSDSPLSAAREIAFFFHALELTPPVE